MQTGMKFKMTWWNYILEAVADCKKIKTNFSTQEVHSLLDKSDGDNAEILKALYQPNVNHDSHAHVWLGSVRSGFNRVTDEFRRNYGLDDFIEHFPSFRIGKSKMRDNFPKSVILTENLQFRTYGPHVGGFQENPGLDYGNF